MQRRGSPAEVSIGVNSKEQLLRFKLFSKDTWFVILVSLTVIMSKTFLLKSIDVEGHQNFH